MGLPNWITLARIALVPVFIAFAFNDSDTAAVAALVVFAVASLSDTLDGYLARRHDSASRIGAFLDPLADKLLVGAALVSLVATTSFPLWAAIVIGAREIAVQVLRIQIVRSGGTLPASPVAKAKTMLQLVMVCWWLLPVSVSPIHWLLLVSVLITTLWSGLEYFRHVGRLQEQVP